MTDDPLETTTTEPQTDRPQDDVKTYPRHTGPKPPVFQSSCWGPGLWIVGFFGLRQLSDLNSAMLRGYREDAVALVLMALIPLSLAALFDISRAKRAGTIRPWTWLIITPALGVLAFSAVVVCNTRPLKSINGEAWEIVNPKGAHCSVAMPGQPHELAVPDASAQPGVDIHVFALNHGDEGYTIAYYRYPDGALDGNAVNAMKDKMTSLASGEIRDDHDAKLDTIPSKEFTFDVEDKKMSMTCRIGRAGNTLYALGYSGPLHSTNRNMSDYFFSSFKVVRD